jgi:5-methylcytosine-specific restriction endonuclease McrA
MSKNRTDVGHCPKYIRCSPLSRTFPEGWKDIVFGRSGKADTEDGAFYYACPICGGKFDFSSIGDLEGDHIWPYSLFGETTWENYQLICGKCNAQKRDHLNVGIRKVLGSGEFRKSVTAFLQEKVEDGELPKDVVIKSILAAER